MLAPKEETAYSFSCFPQEHFVIHQGKYSLQALADSCCVQTGVWMLASKGWPGGFWDCQSIKPHQHTLSIPGWRCPLHQHPKSNTDDAMLTSPTNSAITQRLTLMLNWPYQFSHHPNSTTADVMPVLLVLQTPQNEHCCQADHASFAITCILKSLTTGLVLLSLWWRKKDDI